MRKSNANAKQYIRALYAMDYDQVNYEKTLDNLHKKELLKVLGKHEIFEAYI